MKPLKLSTIIPAFSWMKSYKKEYFSGDFSAGITVAVMLVPQSMAYALLAGLPAIYGLYASMVPLFVYSLFGTSKQLAVGPVAMDSILVAFGVAALQPSSVQEYVSYAIAFAFLVGVIQFLMGLLRLGFLTNFLSHPIISGFTSAAALIIASSQLKHLTGLSLERSYLVHKVVWQLLTTITEANIYTLAISACSIAIIISWKKIFPKIPSALVSVLFCALVVQFFRLDLNGVSVVGSVPKGFPDFELPSISIEKLNLMLPVAFSIAFVGFMEAISIATSLASQNRYKISPNQELVGIGLANIIGSFFQTYPVTGGFSRTAVNAQAGAKTNLSGIITAVFILITVLFLTPLFYYLPKATLASIVIVAVIKLFDWREIIHLWKIKKTDLLIWGVTFVATLSVGILNGILIGIATSIFVFMIMTTKPHYAVLGRLGESFDYRNILRFSEAKEIEGIKIIRIDAQFYYGNVTFLKDTLEGLIDDFEGLKNLIIEASSINNLDSSADNALHHLIEDFQKRGVEIYFANVKGPVRDIMKRSGFSEKLGENHFFLNVHDVVKHLTK